MGEAAHASGQGVYQKSLPLLLSFAMHRNLQQRYQLVGTLINGRGRCTCVRAGGIPEVSAPSAQFCYAPKSALKKQSIKQSKTKYVFKAQTFLSSLRLIEALFGDRMRRGKVGWGRQALGLEFPLWEYVTPSPGLPDGLRRLPLSQSIILSLLDSAQGNSGSIYHIYSHPQALSIMWSCFLLVSIHTLCTSKHIILLDPRYFFFLLLLNFTYLFLAVLGLCCCAPRLSPVVALRLLIAMASLASEPGLQRVQAQQLWCRGLAAWRPVGSSGTRILNHWTTREIPPYLLYICGCTYT